MTTNDADAPLADSRVQELWESFKATGDERSRESLILHYSGLVKFVAGRVGVGLPKSVDQADLASYGLFGLIDAIDKFDPERGFKFETYAISRIRGAILDELRALDWVPRSVRARAREIDRVIGELEHALGRSPSDEEIAEKMDLPVEQLQDHLGEISRLGVIGLEDTLGGMPDAPTVGDRVSDRRGISPESAFHDQEMKHLLADAINRLPDRERLVLTLYYYEGMTLAEIGTVLSVTESRICQIHTKSLMSLRHRLSDRNLT